MQILLAFLPFATFAVASRFAGTTTALALAAVVSLALILYGVAIKKQSVRLLEAGTFILFCGLAAYAKLTGAQWPVLGVRLGVDVGLLIIVLSSMVIRQPFTLQYAKESVPKEHWGEPKFIETNNKLTSVWAAAFAAIVVADASMFFVPSIPMAVGIAVTVAALFAAARYTSKITG